MLYFIFAACAWLIIVSMSVWFRIKCIDHLRLISKSHIEPDPTIFNDPTRKLYDDVLFGRHKTWTKDENILSDFNRFRLLIIIQITTFGGTILILLTSSLI